MRKVVLCLTAFLVGAAKAGGAIITDPSQLQGSTSIIDFESVETNGALVTSLSNPVTFGDVTFTSVTGQLSIFDISVSGSWPLDLPQVSSKTLFPGGEPDSAIAIEFANPISQILIGWGDPNFAGNRLRAFDAAGNLLEEATPQLGPPGNGFGSWIGFNHSLADIAKVVVMPDQSLPSGDDYVIDNIYYGTATGIVPEPTSLAIWGGISLMGVVVGWRRRKRNSSAGGGLPNLTSR